MLYLIKVQKMLTYLTLFFLFCIWFNGHLGAKAERKHGNPYSSVNKKRKRK